MFVWRGLDQPHTAPPATATVTAPMRPPRASVARVCLTALLALTPLTAAYDLDPDSRESILDVAKDMATDMMTFYTGNKPGARPAIFPCHTTAVFNTQAARWSTEYCNGGLRWQIFEWNNGFDYKNTISQACFFSLGARLALYTGNKTYAEWAEKTWDWTSGVGYIDDKWNVYDGGYINDNCTELTPYQWTYNIGGFLLGAAAMYNYTEDEKWKDRIDGLLTGSEKFFKGDNRDIMTEVACESVDRCNIDQQSFKAYFSRWLANVVKWYPGAAEKVMPWLRASSVAAASQCTGGDNGRMCGLKWSSGSTWDGTTGLGQQMAALEVTLANLIEESRAPVTADNGEDSHEKQVKSQSLGPRAPGKFSSTLASLGIGTGAAGFVGGFGHGKGKERLDSNEKVDHATHTSVLASPPEMRQLQTPPRAAMPASGTSWATAPRPLTNTLPEAFP
ncbi:unnamed protein product [Parascedosporium putredinis]|uniref:mannan endo-1,6-alpha-mannosidase n=1 Tax=Parascedosporium putredinis TaxID=1442378 RepID=A0A9P1GV58_9PEZI|nr:unnamed protein product [Parascedosporium putredinis]CAI7988237.1 unnamed protein product [Parascedosporium putredinis]